MRRLLNKTIFLVDDNPGTKLTGLIRALEDEIDPSFKGKLFPSIQRLHTECLSFYKIYKNIESKSTQKTMEALDGPSKALEEQLTTLQKTPGETLRTDSQAIHFFTNGQQAFEGYKEMIKEGRNVDIIITDFEMPVMNGLELVKQIRQEEERLGIKRAFICSNSNHDDFKDQPFKSKDGKQLADTFIPGGLPNRTIFNNMMNIMIETINNNNNQINNNTVSHNTRDEVSTVTILKQVIDSENTTSLPFKVDPSDLEEPKRKRTEQEKTMPEIESDSKKNKIENAGIPPTDQQILESVKKNNSY